jgi:hypothetical protein
MTSRNEIVTELAEIGSQLVNMPNIVPYVVPEGYFEELPALVMMRIKTEHVQSAEEETAIISPLLASLKKESPLTVPDGYFETLAPKMPPVEKKPETARVISFNPDKLFKYAAAAVTVGLISLFAWLFLRTPSSDNQYAVNQDTTIDNQVQQKIEGMTDIDIATYLDINELTTMESRDIQVPDDDVTLMLAEVSDQELENYLKTHGTVKEKFN